jgi:hypothetical protein
VKRALGWLWWGLAAVALVAVALNLAQPHPADDTALASKATAALDAERVGDSVLAVGATSDGHVYVTLSRTASDFGSPARLSVVGHDVATAIVGAVPSATIVTVLDANHAVVDSYRRGR